jgi:hypothetical protein
MNSLIIWGPGLLALVVVVILKRIDHRNGVTRIFYQSDHYLRENDWDEDRKRRMCMYDE